MDTEQQAEYFTTYADTSLKYGRTNFRIPPPMAEFLQHHPEVLAEYRETRQVCGSLNPLDNDPRRLFMCGGPRHDDEECPPYQTPSLTEMKAAQQLTLDI